MYNFGADSLPHHDHEQLQMIPKIIKNLFFLLDILFLQLALPINNRDSESLSLNYRVILSGIAITSRCRISCTTVIARGPFVKQATVSASLVYFSFQVFIANFADAVNG